MSRAGERLAVLAAVFAPGRTAELLALFDDPEATAVAARSALLERIPRPGRLAALGAALQAPDCSALATEAASKERGRAAAAVRGARPGLPARSHLLGRLLAESWR